MPGNFGSIPNNISINPKQSIRRKSDDSGFETYIGVETIVAGTNITVDNTNPSAPVISATGSGSGGHTIQDEGVSLPRRSKLNFVGDRVVATDDSSNNATVVTINKTGDMFKSDNLSGLTDYAVARANLGLGNVDNTSDLNKPISNATQAALNNKLDKNSPITGATKTKITYDSKGLVTAGADATTADIPDSTDKRYVTDAQLNDINNIPNKADKGSITTSGLTQSSGKLLGRSSSGTGNIEEITLGTGLSFSGTTLNATGGGGGNSVTITIEAGENISGSASSPKALYIGSDGKAYLTSAGIGKYIGITTQTVSAGSNVDIITSGLRNVSLTAGAKYYVSNGTNADTWTTKANMTTARQAATASVVNNIIYCIGGWDGTNYLATNEAYNPSTNTWTTKASMTTARKEATSSVVNDIIYCIGGTNGSVLGTNEAYDPSTNTWMTKASMPTARTALSSAVVNGIIYCMGGWNGSSAIATNEAYNPSNNTWTTKASMPTNRASLVSLVYNDIIYCIGGYNGSGLSTNEAYNPSNNTWSTKASMPTARYELTGQVVNGIIYCIGGNNGSALRINEAYNPSTNTWSTKASMPTARRWLTSSLVNNIIYCIGGHNGTNNVTTNEAYNPLGTPTGDLTTSYTTLVAGQTATSTSMLISSNVL